MARHQDHRYLEDIDELSESIKGLTVSSLSWDHSNSAHREAMVSVDSSLSEETDAEVPIHSGYIPGHKVTHSPSVSDAIVSIDSTFSDPADLRTNLYYGYNSIDNVENKSSEKGAVVSVDSSIVQKAKVKTNICSGHNPDHRAYKFDTTAASASANIPLASRSTKTTPVELPSVNEIAVDWNSVGSYDWSNRSGTSCGVPSLEQHTDSCRSELDDEDCYHFSNVSPSPDTSFHKKEARTKITKVTETEADWTNLETENALFSSTHRQEKPCQLSDHLTSDNNPSVSSSESFSVIDNEVGFVLGVRGASICHGGPKSITTRLNSWEGHPYNDEVCSYSRHLIENRWIHSPEFTYRTTEGSLVQLEEIPPYGSQLPVSILQARYPKRFHVPTGKDSLKGKIPRCFWDKSRYSKQPLRQTHGHRLKSNLYNKLYFPKCPAPPKQYSVACQCEILQLKQTRDANTQFGSVLKTKGTQTKRFTERSCGTDALVMCDKDVQAVAKTAHKTVETTHYVFYN